MWQEVTPTLLPAHLTLLLAHVSTYCGEEPVCSEQTEFCLQRHEARSQLCQLLCSQKEGVMIAIFDVNSHLPHTAVLGFK